MRRARPSALRAAAAVRAARAPLLGLALALAAVVPAAAAPDPAALRAIAIAEDQRRWDAELRDRLRDPEPAVRARAALAVGRLQDSAAVETLLPLLDDAVFEVRHEAAFALGQIGHRSARAALEARLAGPDTALARLAIEALGKLGDRAATPRVAAFLGHADPRLRGEAAVALWRLADSTALPALLARHDDPDREARWRVLWALEKIVVPDRVVLPVALGLDDPDGWVRAVAVRTLGRQKSPRATAYVLQKLDDPEVAVQVNALRALQSIADSTCAACGARIADRLASPLAHVRVTAAAALGDRFVRVGEDLESRRRADSLLAATLSDPDPATRGAAARALIARRGGEALDAVRPLLADSARPARIAAIQAVGLLPAETAAPLLEPLLAPARPLPDRMAAADALAAAGARAALPALRAGLADTSMLFVAAAASALGDLGDSASVRRLAEAYARRARDADADARVSIRDALRALAGRAFADSVERRHAAPPPAAASYPADFHVPSPVRGAVLHTSAGPIEWAFEREAAVQTVKNFVRLAERGYFDGVAFHRVVPNFVIQDGDPTGTGSGGPGTTIRCEYNRLRYEPGRVGMALSGKDTGGSQWFITHSPQPHLDGRYTIFARVTRGFDVVHRVVPGDRVLRVELLR